MEIIETYDSVDLVPVLDTRVDISVRFQFEIHLLIEQDIEEEQEKNAISELRREVFQLGSIVFGENHVNNGENLLVLLHLR